jgi:hypothetical protein
MGPVISQMSCHCDVLSLPQGCTQIPVSSTLVTCTKEPAVFPKSFQSSQVVKPSKSTAFQSSLSSDIEGSSLLLCRYPLCKDKYTIYYSVPTQGVTPVPPAPEEVQGL